MNCLHPLTIRNPRYKDKRFFNGEFPQDYQITIPCGKCEACLVRKSNEWAFRLQNEYRNSKNAFFITLTYDEENVPVKTVLRCKPNQVGYIISNNLFNGDYIPLTKEVKTFDKKDCQLFIKKLRKHLGKGLRFFLASEYGEDRNRPHYHMILFNVPESRYDWQTRDKLFELVERCWNKGMCTVEKILDERLVYTAKYSLSTLDMPEYMPRPFILASRHPMIGQSFLTKELVDDYRNTLKNYGVDLKGIKYPLSRVYKYKIFSPEQREQMYQEQLDNMVEASEAEKQGYINKIRSKFKKSRVI